MSLFNHRHNARRTRPATPTYIKTPTHFWMTAIRQRPTPSSPEDSAGRTIRVSQFAEAKPTPSLLRVSTCQWRHPENSIKLNQSASGNGRCGCIQSVGVIAYLEIPVSLRSGMYRGVRAAGSHASASRWRSVRPKCEFRHRYG